MTESLLLRARHHTMVAAEGRVKPLTPQARDQRRGWDSSPFW